MNKEIIEKMIDGLKKGLSDEIEYLEKLKLEYGQYPDWAVFFDSETKSRKLEFTKMIKNLTLKLNSFDK